MAGPINVVAFPTGKAINERQGLAAVKAELKNYAGKPVVFVFSDAAFGLKAKTRDRSKVFVNQLHNLVSQHGNAFVFLSLPEGVGSNPAKRIFSTTGYIVTPSPQKKWVAYPKITSYEQNVSRDTSNWDAPRRLLLSSMVHMDDLDFLRKNSSNFEHLLKNIEHWIRRSNKIKYFPQIHLNGKTIQLRICSDIAQTRHNEPVDLIINAADGARFMDHADARAVLKPQLRREGSVLVVDSNKVVELFPEASSRIKVPQNGIEHNGFRIVPSLHSFKTKKVTPARHIHRR